jgi:hypothetical protein
MERTYNMESTDSTPSLLEDDALRKAPDKQLVAMLNIGGAKIGELTVIAISAASNALQYAVKCGQILEEAFRRHDGEFADWLACNIAEKADGKKLICEDTARKWRTLWRKRDQLYPPDGGEPLARTITEAYIKLGLIPEPIQTEPDPHAVKPVFHLTFSATVGDVEKWPPAERRAFLTKAEPIVRAYERALELARSA